EHGVLQHQPVDGAGGADPDRLLAVARQAFGGAAGRASRRAAPDPAAERARSRAPLQLQLPGPRGARPPRAVAGPVPGAALARGGDGAVRGMARRRAGLDGLAARSAEGVRGVPDAVAPGRPPAPTFRLMKTPGP